jgi:hypothetical protein
MAIADAADTNNKNESIHLSSTLVFFHGSIPFNLNHPYLIITQTHATK